MKHPYFHLHSLIFFFQVGSFYFFIQNPLSISGFLLYFASKRTNEQASEWKILTMISNFSVCRRCSVNSASTRSIIVITFTPVIWPNEKKSFSFFQHRTHAIHNTQKGSNSNERYHCIVFHCDVFFFSVERSRETSTKQHPDYYTYKKKSVCWQVSKQKKRNELCRFHCWWKRDMFDSTKRIIPLIYSNEKEEKNSNTPS